MPEEFDFTEKFDDQNEADHNIGQGDVIEAVFYGERIHVSFEYGRGRKRRRKILASTESLNLTIIVECSKKRWSVLSALPSDDADRKRFDSLATENPNMVQEKPDPSAESGKEQENEEKQ